MPASLLIGVSALLLASPLFDRGLESVDAGVPSSELSVKACVGCHPHQSAEWSQSRHAVSITSDIFARDFRAQPAAWCINCHAPLKQQGRAIRAGKWDGLAAEGINCAACHLRDGQFISRTKSSRSPHNTRIEPGFGGKALCEGCHEFNFPSSTKHTAITFTSNPMQSTMSEVASHGGEACVTCHGSPYGHGFPGASRPQIVRDAIRSRICRTSGGQVRVELENTGAAHNIPTGGVNRHLRLDLWRSAFPERGVEQFIGRRFRSLPTGGKETIQDTSLLPDQLTRWHFAADSLGGKPQDPINVRLRYVLTPEEWGPTQRIGDDPAHYDLWAVRRPLEAWSRCVD